MTEPRARYSATRLATLLEDDFGPTPQQAVAIEAPVAPQLIVAGAGSGKTGTMAARVVWLIANGHARPEQILGLTFTRKAASELATRIRRRIGQLGRLDDVGDLSGEPTVSTYHSYASGIVAEHGPRIGVEPGTILSPAQTWQLAYAAVKGHDGDMSAVSLSVETVVKRVLSLSDELSEHLREPDELEQYTQQLADEIRDRVGKGTQKTAQLLRALQSRLQLLPIVADYRRRKRAAGAMDFADQLHFAASVAAAVPEVGRVERERFTVVLLDEYQDTSHAQVELLKSLFGGGHPVTAVGDPCQSIYAWRGASTGTLTRFGGDFPHADGAQADRMELTASWRNRAAILAVANDVSEPLRTMGFPVSPLEPGVPGDGRVTAAMLNTADDEAEWVATHVHRLWLEHGYAPDSPVPGEPPSTAVLARRRSQIPRLEKALRAKGLPVEVIGLGGLLDAPEVRELHATLTVLARPTAGPAFMRLLTGPRWRIGPRDLAALHARARELAPERRGFEPSAEGLTEASLVEALEDLGEPRRYSEAAAQRFELLRRELAYLRSRMDQPVGDLIAEILKVSGLDIEVAVHRGDSERLDAFMDEAVRYGATATLPSLDGFLSFLDAAEERERGLELTGTTEHTGAVQILTVHAAKGLEWDCVAVPGLAKGVLPGRVQGGSWLTDTGKLPYPLRGDAAELPVLRLGGVTKAAELGRAESDFKRDVQAHHEVEERRLAYVGLTRAREHLFASGYWWDEAESAREPSPYLNEAVAAGARVDEWVDDPGEENPLLAVELRTDWPDPNPLGNNQLTVAAAAGAVRASDAVAHDSERARNWAEEAELLLAERVESAAADGVAVPVPSQLSVSQLVAWHADAQEFAARLRRPVPEPPAPHTRRGTAFHAWVEHHFAGGALFDLDELPGAADGEPDTDAELATLQAAFEASDWANRTPVAVEVPFVTVLEGVVVRGRMDAVFATDDGGWEIVDWKTGRPPRGAAATAAAVQLAAYREAWALLRGVNRSKVSAAFHYVRQNVTVRPRNLPVLEQLAEPLGPAQ